MRWDLTQDDRVRVASMNGSLRLIGLTCLTLLGGCAIANEGIWSDPEDQDRDFTGTLAVYRRMIATDYGKFLKYAGGLQAPRISALRRAHPVAPGDWVACLKGEGEGVVRTHAVFFQKRRIVDVRVAVMIDECDQQAFEPLDPAPG
jgi:hypothetical protein